MKIDVKLPFYEQVTVDELNKFMDEPVVLNEEGKFVFCATLKEDNRQLNVYTFLFTQAVGCRNYLVTAHGRLPPTTGRTMKDSALLKLAGDSVSNSYYYQDENEGPAIAYDGVGGYTMKYESSDIRDVWCEDDRAENFRKKVQEHFNSENKRLQIKKRSTICINTTSLRKKCSRKESVTPFAGGGDNVVMASVDNQTLIIGGTNEGEFGDPEEARLCLSVEHKERTTQTDEQIQGQLKADMYLMTGIIFLNNIVDLQNHSHPITRLQKIKKLSSYGLTFGIFRPVLILKFTIDFDSQRLEYIKKYECYPGVPPEPRVDCGIKYLIMRLTNRSPPPQ